MLKCFIMQTQNRLKNEKSPYLLQHADNPVDWYPWCEEAFEKARNENKPVFLSIGYSTCHWCHVMEHESFEDHEVASLMNDVFISIKVDREERPDIDTIYMTFCQLITGSGGWPLTIIMTPDKKPFFAGTYFPKDNSYGRTGMIELTKTIHDIWTTKHDDVLNSAEQIIALLKDVTRTNADEFPDPSILADAFQQLSENFKPHYGGFSDAPKFPTAHNLFYLLRYWKRTGAQKSLKMIETTLNAMRKGGIFDHIGFGFHRYSTDSKWLVPHFEKMLYDQALLAMAYTETYQATGKNEYKATAQQLLTYIMQDMTSPDGAFYSAEDADSEGEEGKFYLWTLGDLYKVLNKKEIELVCKIYNIDIEKEANNIELGIGKIMDHHILHSTKTLSEWADELKTTTQDLSVELEGLRQKLFDFRNSRVHPHKDDKILTDWNGLMIAAFAKAGQNFEQPLYINTAEHAVSFILEKMIQRDGRLLHRYRDGQAAIPAYLDDYAFLTWSLIELYEATFNTDYLKRALEFTDILLTHFWDVQNGGFYFTADDGEQLLTRSKEVYDGAIPSGNSIAAMNLLRLARMTGNAQLEEKGKHLIQAFSHLVTTHPLAYVQLLVALDFTLGPTYEVVIAGNSQAEDTQRMIQSLRTSFTPHIIMLLRPTEIKNPAIISIAPFTEYHTSIDGKATAYVCRNHACQLPTINIDHMLALLK
ncbi:MAG: thioredoxin [Candidatus Fischerbacteria bacterium RBG_13_37_8]|uniref:Thioredoxin n=1 Tax=Candidatus Fischerbacteria bacterium RBG_13_37_8 TaxID=1817863 RepID=A0A1F5VVE8_9BACT|nr:MAG: thioredoxin [Candidatus Fischerbacteria bacterium RBG_13_37_8]